MNEPRQSPSAQAKSRILCWFHKNAEPAEKRRKLLSGIDRFFDELAKRDTWSEGRTTLLVDEGASTFGFQASGRDWHVAPCRNGLAVSTVIPVWDCGWSAPFRDEYVRDVLSSLAFAARHYIYRSHLAKVLMIAWEENGTILTPFGSEIHFKRYGPMLPAVAPHEALRTAIQDGVAAWGTIANTQQSQSTWASRNTLDPAIHEAIFHFLRGQALRSEGFEIEALVAFRCVLEALQRMPWDKSADHPKGTSVGLVATLGMGSEDGELSEFLRFLRNHFGAHAGGWCWWDTDEFIDADLMSKASDLALRLLQRAADREACVRRIDPEPERRSDWLLEHFDILFPAIWLRSEG